MHLIDNPVRHSWEVGQRVVPIYVSVILMLLGWPLGFGTVSLAVYAVVVAIGFNLRVVWADEPWLARTHGVEWQVYRHSVHRWIERGQSRSETPDGT